MKTQEEIEKLAEQLYPISPNPQQIIEGFERVAFKNGYTQCQEDNTPYFTEETWNTMCSRISELQSELKDKKYTEEDMLKMHELSKRIVEKEWHDSEFCITNCTCEPLKLRCFNDIIESINKQDL